MGVGGVHSFNAKEAALCKLQGWEHVRECSIKEVTSRSVVVACKTTTSDAFYGNYRIPAPTALRVLGSRRGERGSRGGRDRGGDSSPLFPSGGAARTKAAAAAAAAVAAAAREQLSPGEGDAGPSKVG